MSMSYTIAIHLASVTAATLIGPFALWARLGKKQRPKLHRALGYAWVTLMLATAISACFIRDFQLPNIAGYTPIHLLVPLTIGSIVQAFRYLAQGNIRGHQKTMQYTYISTCLVAGAFTLLPGRYLGNLLWRDLLGVM
jgi:uncharacterized membrane protein